MGEGKIEETKVHRPLVRRVLSCLSVLPLSYGTIMGEGKIEETVKSPSPTRPSRVILLVLRNYNGEGKIEETVK